MEAKQIESECLVANSRVDSNYYQAITGDKQCGRYCNGGFSRRGRKLQPKFAHEYGAMQSSVAPPRRLYPHAYNAIAYRENFLFEETSLTVSTRKTFG
ncbi:hypothetical protein EVAR_27954_1 [Eumeta japonica]|uniref:Uncharacterized protein n=1 Tax=Eumeta variegata TaxID=151549 RepID=A0A4C1ZWV1_EUMVA|nr:hypothetical protein EVAR_27954_1 [Eumeta japonica]